MPVVWAPGEPDNKDNGEDCLVMLLNGTLADVNCSDVYRYVCYRKEQKNTAELNVCGSVDNDYTLDKSTGSCYKFHTSPLQWHRAIVVCAREGGHLAVINSRHELEVIKKLFSKTSSNMVPGKYNKNIAFLGFRNFEEHFLWMTIHGQTLKEAGFDMWSNGQPDRSGGREDCGALDKDKFFDDQSCWNLLPFVCEKQPSSLLADED